MDRLTDGQTDRRTQREMNGLGVWTDGWMDREDIWTDGHTDNQRA